METGLKDKHGVEIKAFDFVSTGCKVVKLKPADHGEHCWHDTGVDLLSNPPMQVEICCWCGSEQHHVKPGHSHPLRAAGEHGPVTTSLVDLFMTT